MSTVRQVFDSPGIELSSDGWELRIGDTIRCLRSGEIRECDV